jgi:hypothetical protein
MAQTFDLIPEAVWEYIKTTMDDAQTGDDTSGPAWDAVLELPDRSAWVDALREWYDETGGEDEDPRLALAFVLRQYRRALA